MQWVNLFCNDAVDVLASSQARLKHGFAVEGDLLWFPSEETIGSASGFIEIVRLNSVENILLVQVHAHKRLDNKTWSEDGEPKLLSLSLARNAVPYVKTNNGTRPIFHDVL